MITRAASPSHYDTTEGLPLNTPSPSEDDDKALSEASKGRHVFSPHGSRAPSTLFYERSQPARDSKKQYIATSILSKDTIDLLLKHIGLAEVQLTQKKGCCYSRNKPYQETTKLKKALIHIYEEQHAITLDQIDALLKDLPVPDELNRSIRLSTLAMRESPVSRRPSLTSSS